MKKGMVFNFQRFSIHDGPGIRTVIFFKGCPLSCLWCSNPESQEVRPQRIYSKKDCIGCLRCVEKPEDFQNKLQVGNPNCCPTDALSCSGRIMSSDEVVEEVLKDLDHFRNSGGGVTFSGGEPLMQWSFVQEIARKLRENKVHLAIETTGYGKWEQVKQVLDQVDLVLYDVKHMDSNKHKEGTGVTNELILENLKKVALTSKNVIIRIPLIKGYNDYPENIDALVDYAKTLGIGEIHLLPYHNWGVAKYEKLGKEYAGEFDKPSTLELNTICDRIKKMHIDCTIGG